MVTSLGINVGQLGWLKFDVTKVVNSWYTTNRDAARDKLTLLVDCTGCGSHVYVSTFDGHSPHVIESSLNAKGTLVFQRASLSYIYNDDSQHLKTKTIIRQFYILCKIIF